MTSARLRSPQRPFVPFARRRNPAVGKYWAVLLIVCVLLFVAQSWWMKHVRETQQLNVSSSLIFKLTDFMQDKAGKATAAEPTHTPATLPVIGSGPAGGASPALAPGTEIVACELCAGLGRSADPQTGAEMTCPLCQGHGSRLLRRLSPQDQLCPACGGMGMRLNANGRSASTCERCDGRGLIESGASADAAQAQAKDQP